MTKFTKIPVEIEATQWFKNGDHPEDDMWGLQAGDVVSESEGKIVRYFNHPFVASDHPCVECGDQMRDHGWIDTRESGHVVCPGDWIITGVEGEHYPCKPSVFEKNYAKTQVGE